MGRVPSRRVWLGALVATTLLALSWHASPLLLWHLSFESQLTRDGDARRLTSERWDSLPLPTDTWPQLTSGELSLRAPFALEALPACGRCASGCRLPLDNRGTLGIFDELPPASYHEVLDHFSPDARDLSLLRTVASNWRTIDALTDRARAALDPPESFRFVASGSRGVVTAYRVDGVRRYVIYAFAPDGGAGRVIGVAGLEQARFEGLLGGLQVEPARAQRASRCSPKA